MSITVQQTFKQQNKVFLSFEARYCFYWCLFARLSKHLSYDDCLEDQREDYQNCSVLYCVTQLWTLVCTLIWTVLVNGLLEIHDCVVLSVSAVWTELETRQDCRRQKISKLSTFSFFEVLSENVGLNKTVQSEIYWGLLKTVLSCLQFSSHHQHRQDKIVLSCPYWQCELGISDKPGGKLTLLSARPPVAFLIAEHKHRSAVYRVILLVEQITKELLSEWSDVHVTNSGKLLRRVKRVRTFCVM